MRFSTSVLAPWVLLIASPAAARICNSGTRTSYTGDCTGFSDTDLIAPSTCTSEGDSAAEFCTTYSYQVTLSGCTTTSVVATCSLMEDACTDVQQQWGDSDGYHCETCSSDNCNPAEHVVALFSSAEQKATPSIPKKMMLWALLFVSVATAAVPWR
mmetsp:Transcript_35925/g.84087  ORF Transcript_35925/g.84087 Transcript_35925/m.84087 type:complete len:156 (-) Transcript_35925:282-749(-)